MSYTKAIQEAAREDANEAMCFESTPKVRLEALIEGAEHWQDLAEAIRMLGITDAERIYAAEFASAVDSWEPAEPDMMGPSEGERDADHAALYFARE
jgi:hypothetical protein